MKQAKKIKLFDENGNQLHDYKAVANEVKETEIFSVVKNGYRIIQHDAVLDTVNEIIKDKNLNGKVNPIEMNNGGRVHITVNFPDINLDIENNGILASLYCTYDNSYDGTTGLRLGVAAKLGHAILWINDSRYYHKHTKSVSVEAFEKKLDKGISSFQDKIKTHFMDMFKTPVYEGAILDFLEKTIDVKSVSKTYIDSITSRVKQSTIKNKWQLYCIICEVVTKEAGNVDTRDRQLKAIIGNLHKVFPSNKTKVTTPPIPEGGATLNQVVEKQNEKASKEGIELLQNNTSGLLGMVLMTPQKLSVVKVSKRKFKVMKGDTEIKRFKRRTLAEKFISKTA